MIEANTPDNFYVITGGPGVGKTTTINELQKLGYLIVPEDARRIIQGQIQTGGKGLPWKDKTNYARLMLEASIQTYLRITGQQSSKVSFFDRGILDTICYMKMENIPVSAAVDGLATIHRYNRKVFILPPWKDIYEMDNERKQTWHEAVYTFKKMKQTYLEYGYEIIEVPKDSVKFRCEFIVNQIK